MGLNMSDIDGKYEVKSETSSGGPYVVNGDGITEIRNGLTYRKDAKGFIWESSFSVINDHQVQMESTVDPSHAGDNAFIHDAKGNLTKGMMTYKTILDAKEENGKLVLSGVIEHGAEKTRILMTKL